MQTPLGAGRGTLCEGRPIPSPRLMRIRPCHASPADISGGASMSADTACTRGIIGWRGGALGGACMRGPTQRRLLRASASATGADSAERDSEHAEEDIEIVEESPARLGFAKMGVDKLFLVGICHHAMPPHHLLHITRAHMLYCAHVGMHARVACVGMRRRAHACVHGHAITCARTQRCTVVHMHVLMPSRQQSSSHL